MKFKKTLLLIASFLLIIALSVAATLAYLAATDEAVNTLTLGSVKIEQYEYQRELDSEGNYVVGTVDGRESYLLEEFVQDKPMIPVTGDPEGSEADKLPVIMSQVDSYGEISLFTTPNVQDKFVTVENTGKTDAYVRTLVAIEIGSSTIDLIGSSYHNSWTRSAIGAITIDGVSYYLYEFVYNGGQSGDGSPIHENGVLPANETTYPSLAQVYLSFEATNEDCIALDGNKNGKLDILVFSQAVQATGFENAVSALDEAFGDISAENHPWA